MRYFIFFLFGMCHLCAHHDLSICAIFKNEAPFLDEWVCFHKKMGVQHFYLYNNGSEDDYESVLALHDDVTLIDWNFDYEAAQDDESNVPWIDIQRGAYIHCLENFGDENQWIAFIDIDEFLFCPSGEQLPSFLEGYEEFGGLMVNWVVFGTSFVEEIPEGQGLIETFTLRARDDYYRNAYAKSIVQPRFATGPNSVHAFFYCDGYFAVNPHKEMVDHRYKVEPPSHDLIRINHYWTKSEKFFREHKLPDRLSRRAFQTREVLEGIANELNELEDYAIQQITFS